MPAITTTPANQSNAARHGESRPNNSLLLAGQLLYRVKQEGRNRVGHNR